MKKLNAKQTEKFLKNLGIRDIEFLYTNEDNYEGQKVAVVVKKDYVFEIAVYHCSCDAFGDIPYDKWEVIQWTHAQYRKLVRVRNKRLQNQIHVDEYDRALWLWGLSRFPIKPIEYLSYPIGSAGYIVKDSK